MFLEECLKGSESKVLSYLCAINLSTIILSTVVFRDCQLSYVLCVFSGLLTDVPGRCSSLLSPLLSLLLSPLLRESLVMFN